jgi:hypothetical protein
MLKVAQILETVLPPAAIPRIQTPCTAYRQIAASVKEIYPVLAQKFLFAWQMDDRLGDECHMTIRPDSAKILLLVWFETTYK